MNIAVILAGGSGVRMGKNLPKQFMKLGDKSIIEHTIEAFERNAGIDRIFVVCREDSVSMIRQLVKARCYRKVTDILSGGKERYHSSLAAIGIVENDEDNLLFHDAVRPLVSQRIIKDCLIALERYRAVDVAIKAVDTIIQVDENDMIVDIPPRASLRCGQTPQGFRAGVIRRAYELAVVDPDFRTTDDCGVVKHYLPQEPIFVVDGESINMKLTYQEDLPLLEQYYYARQQAIQ